MQTKTSTRKSLMRKACPRCGGDICRMRDTFGFYHRCAQCGREFRLEPAVAMPTAATAAVSINAQANPTEHKEVMVA